MTMPWKVVERKIGRAGGQKQRTARQRQWDRKYGEGNGAVGYVVDGAFVPQEQALESIYLERHGLRLRGAEVVDIGSWKGLASHALSARLSPLHVKVTGDPKTTLEQFWQERKCLAIWEEG
jgi:hypothetical protein